ncbi:hypothetical protein [Fortiea contorta]|uniref:hypothetical protein n=1 Tax=Fortiea contorta TaxID=1892405 RepID=UPI00034BC270|nr:hypothetical protein [Fortiea contorta]
MLFFEFSQLNTLYLDNFEFNNQLEYVASPKTKSLFVADSFPLIHVKDLKNITKYTPLHIPNIIVEPKFTRVADLETKLTDVQSCSPDLIRKPEFTRVADLEAKINNLSCDLNEKNYSSIAQNNQQIPKTKPENTEYITAPRIIPKNKLNTFLTTIPINGRNINHLTNRDVILTNSFGDAQNRVFDVNAIFRLSDQVEESLTKKNIFTLRQIGSYIQLQTVNTKKKITVNIQEPRTLLGTQIQLSLVGSCIFPGTNPDKQCTFTPGVVTNRNAIDQDTLLPKEIFQPSQLANIVTPESLAAIKEPGFQQGANGQEVGINLFFPNSGYTFGNLQADKVSIRRTENLENTPVGIYSTVNQVIKANDQEAVIGRTVRSLTVMANDDNRLLNSAAQLASLFLPDANPKLADSSKPVNQNINKNLIFAANNVWTPPNSLMFYHAGIGRAKTPPPQENTPASTFNSIWIGTSPISKYSRYSKSYYQILSPQRIVSASGAEGGANSNVSLLSLVNNQSFSTATLKDYYAQIYLTISNQDVNYITYSTLTEDKKYYPHISFSGNITSNENIWRYYAGIIGDDNLKAYIGTDFTRNTLDGWTFFTGAIAYANPDNEYYSQVQGGISKNLKLNSHTNLFLSASVNYALDGETPVDDIVINSIKNSLNLSARANIGNISLGLTNSFGNILPNSSQNSLTTDLTITFNQNFQISGYYTPINENFTRSRYGASALLKFGDNNKFSILSFSWTNNEYIFGKDADGNQLSDTNNTFFILLRSNL